MLCGVLSLHTDLGRKIRFFSERGVTWRTYWLGKSTVWLGLGATFIGTLAVWFYAKNQQPQMGLFEHVEGKRMLLMCGITVLLAAFFLGQFAALHSQSLLHGLGLAVASGIALCFWTYAVKEAKLSPLAAVGPIAIGTVLAVLVRLRPWMDLRNDWRGRGPSMVVCLGTAFACWLVPTLTLILRVPAAPDLLPLVEYQDGDDALMLPGGKGEVVDVKRLPRQWKLIAKIGQSAAAEAVARGELQTAPPEDFDEEQQQQWERDLVTAEFPGLPFAGYTNEDESLAEIRPEIEEEVRTFLSEENLNPVMEPIADVAYQFAWQLAMAGKNRKAINLVERIAAASSAGHDPGTYTYIAKLACAKAPLDHELAEYARASIRRLRRLRCWRLADWDEDTVIFDDEDSLVGEFFGRSFVRSRFMQLHRTLVNNGLVRIQKALRDGRPVTDVVKQLSTENEELIEPVDPDGVYRRAIANDTMMDMEIDAIESARLAMALLEFCEHVSRFGDLPKRLSQTSPWSAKPIELRGSSVTGSTRHDRYSWWTTSVRIPKTFADWMRETGIELPKPESEEE